EDRKSSSWLQDAVELVEGTLLVLDVNHDRAGRHDVDRLVSNRSEALGAGKHELAAVERPELAGQLSADIQELLRHVGEDHLALVSDKRERAERDQSVSGTDVEHRIATFDLSGLENALTHRRQMLQCACGLPRVAKAPLEHPVGPGIGH